MAEEKDIALQIKIDASESAKTVKDLKQSLKGLKDELQGAEFGTPEFHKLSDAINKTEGKIGDVNDSFKTLAGSGVERVQSSFSLMKEGFATFDGGKIKAAFSGIGAAMSAIPIFLVIEGFKALIDNWDDVVKFAKKLGSELFNLGSAADDLAEKQEKLKESNNELTKSIDIQIKALSGLKANEEEIIALNEKKLRLNIENAKAALATAIARQREAEAEFNYNEQVLASMGKVAEAKALQSVRTKEERDNTQQAITSLKDSLASLQEFKNKATQKDIDNYKKYLEDKKNADVKYQKALDYIDAYEKKKLQEQLDAKDKSYKNLLTLSKDYFDKEKAQQDELFLKEVNDDNNKRALKNASREQSYNDLLASLELEKQAILDNENLTEEQKTEALRSNSEKRTQIKQDEFNKQMQGTQEALQKTQQLTDLYFQWQLKKNKGNAQAEREIRKKQFNVNKAFGVANSIIDGVGAIQKALNNPYPLNIILAVLTGVLATANTVKIATSKFDDGGGGGGSVSADTGSVGNTNVPAVPQPNNTVTKVNDDGTKTNNTGPQKVYVLEKDITDKQKRITTVEEAAKI